MSDLSSYAGEVLHKRGRKPRAASVDATIRRDAKRATHEITARLTQWHADIARLRGAVEYGSATADTIVQTRLLATELERQHAAFRDALTQLPVEVVSSSWIVDTQKALSRACEMIEAIRFIDRRLG